MMFKISDTCKKILICIFAIGILAFLVGFNFVSNVFAYAQGLLFGTVFSMLKIMLLEKTLNKAVDMRPEDAQNFTRLHYTARFFLTLVVLAVGALVDNVSFLGVIIGLLTISPAVFIVNTIVKKNTEKGGI